MTESNPLILYDIASGPPIRPYAPNPAKARYALNFKRVPHKTAWTELPDIPAAREALGCPAVRRFADGTAYPTLPMLHDPNTGAKVGDSFEIAAYLDDTYPCSGETLFPALTPPPIALEYMAPYMGVAFYAPLGSIVAGPRSEWSRFNIQVDATFSAYIILMAHGMPLNPDTAEQSRAEFVRRFQVCDWDDLTMTGPAREQKLAQFKTALEELGLLLAIKEPGPFIEGEQANYMDIIVGGWLLLLSETLPAEEWTQVRSWHGDVFGRLHDALQQRYWDAK